MMEFLGKLFDLLDCHCSHFQNAVFPHSVAGALTERPTLVAGTGEVLRGAADYHQCLPFLSMQLLCSVPVFLLRVSLCLKI